MGHLEQISVAIPLKINLIQVPEVKENKLDQNYNNNHDKWLPGVDLNYLPEDQRLKVKKLFTEECDAFSKSENDKGQIESWR